MHTISSHTLPANHTIPYQTKPHHSMYTISSHTLLPYHTIPYQTIPNHIPYQAMPHHSQTIIYCTPQYAAHTNIQHTITYWRMPVSLGPSPLLGAGLHTGQMLNTRSLLCIHSRPLPLAEWSYYWLSVHIYK